MKKIVYAKYSNERADRFKIKTVIEQDEEGQRYVKKYAMTEAAKTHIQNIKKHEMALNKCADGTKFIFNHCSIEDGFISCEYVKGEPLSSVLNRMLAQKREEDALSLVQEYVAQLQKMATKTFTATEEFVKVFGKVEFAREQKSCEVTDIDLIFSNILVGNDKWNVIDLEWIFTFPIPVNFLLYRAIRFSGSRIFDFANRFNILAAANISSEEQTIFDQMEQRFQQWVKAEEIALWDVEHMQQRFRIQDVYEENKHLNAEIQKRDAEIQRQNAEIQKRDAEIQRQNAEIQKRDAEIHRQNVENQNLNVLIKNLSGELAAHEAQLDDYKTQQEHDAQHIQNLTVEIQDMSARIHNLNIQHQQLSSQLNCLVNSRSWKITAPLRTMMQKIKSCRLGSLGYRFLKSLKHYGVRATSVKVVNKLRQKWLRPQRSLRKAEDISFHGFVKCARSNGARVFLPGVIEGYAQKEKQRKILFISHEMDLTGAPIVLRNFAMSVLRNGDLPVIISPHAGKLSENIAGHNIPVIVYEGVYSTEFVRRFASLFDIVVVNTIVGSPVIDMLAETSTPVLWWIHEAAHSYYKEMIERLPIEQPGNVSIYCVGSYAEKVLLRYRPTFRTEQLLYHTLDMSANSYNESPVVKDDRLTFAMVGTMQHRKGPDVLADAIMQMPEELVLKSRFLFIGRPVDEYVLQRIDAACRRYPENVQYLGEIPNEKLLSLYQNVDCLICPSRDDPMPCTITEVLLLSVPVICSENTGYAPILRKMGSGKVFPNNNSEVLAKEIAAIVEDRSSLDEMRTLARRTYETHFSEKVFDQNSQKAITDTIARRQFSRSKSVSVVIPTYNAGEEGRRLFEILRNQEGLDRLDIIVVDSGSKDDTVEIARQFGCKVIQIPNEEFSHSYARNLGAQHAETDYLLFMTQDAVPVSKDWINRMVTAVQENNAVAASCREISRPECDLYGQICGFVHNTYMGIVDTDRVMEKPNPWTFESSRKNGQLNDVSCLVRRSVFMRYQFRGNYAEDLDLGLRLISDNFRLMLLSSAPVMHSHTRSAMYHFRRGIVDVVALKRIMPEYPVRDVNVSQAYNRILTTAFMTFYVVRTLLVQVTETITTKQLRKKMWAIYAEAETAARVITKDQIVESIAQDLGVDDGGMRNLVKEILFAAPAVAFDSENFLDVGAFITDQAMSYYDHLGKDISRGDVLDICDTIIKRFGQIVGIVFAEYSMTAVEKDDALDRMIQKYNQGI